MKAKSLVLVVIALACGLVASIGISQVMGKKSTDEAKPAETVKVLIAATDLDIGAPLTEADVVVKTWPKEDVPEGVLTDISQLDGLLSRVRLTQGMPIISKYLSSKINIPIPGGMRVIPVKISASQVFGGIQPGDHVDVLVFLQLRDPETKKETSLVRTVLKDVRLFGVNTKVDRVMKEGKSVSVRTVELLLKPAQVNLLTLAEELGTLRLALRRLDDTDDDDENTLATIKDLLGKPAEDTTENRSSSNELKAFLDDEPRKTMVVLSPTGAHLEYHFNSDPNKPPRVVPVNGHFIPAPMYTPPHNTNNNPAEENNGNG
ncbi:MAG: Flp pilus assembly protein CpaB [Planctomycetes bacterium]|nr:Flp pilus assembly protein CpaB [Planctomycetota bacterium]